MRELLQRENGGKWNPFGGKSGAVVELWTRCSSAILFCCLRLHCNTAQSLGLQKKKIKWKQRSTVGKLKFITRIYTAKRQKGTDLLLHLYNNSSELTFAKMHQLANLRGINQYCGSNYSYTWGPINFKQSTL